VSVSFGRLAELGGSEMEEACFGVGDWEIDSWVLTCQPVYL